MKIRSIFLVLCAVFCTGASAQNKTCTVSYQELNHLKTKVLAMADLVSIVDTSYEDPLKANFTSLSADEQIELDPLLRAQILELHDYYWSVLKLFEDLQISSKNRFLFEISKNLDKLSEADKKKHLQEMILAELYVRVQLLSFISEIRKLPWNPDHGQMTLKEYNESLRQLAVKLELNSVCGDQKSLSLFREKNEFSIQASYRREFPTTWQARVDWALNLLKESIGSFNFHNLP